MQPDTSQPQEPQAPAVESPVPVVEAPIEAKRPRKPIGKIILLILLILAVGGLGYWNYMLDANLKAADLSLAASQSRYNALTTRNAKLGSDLEQTNSSLTQTKAELETTKKSLDAAKLDLSKANGQVSSLKSKKEKALLYSTLLASVFTVPDDDKTKGLVIFIQVALVKDPELTKMYNNYLEHPNQDNFEEWLGYVITKLSEILRG